MPDPFATLPTEISLHTLTFLDPLSLARISSVSKLWYELTSFPDAWMSACLSIYSIALTPTAGVVIADEELETLSKEYRRERLLIENGNPWSFVIPSMLPPWSEMDLSEIRSLRLGLRENFVACCRDPKSFFTDALFITKIVTPPPSPPGRKQFCSLLRYGLAASTSDYQFGQVIGNTLEDGYDVWSSTGSVSGKSEWLCYRMAEDLCLVRCVEIIPSKESSRFPNYIFAPKRIRFSFGFNDNPAQMHYHSRWFDMKCEYAAQYFDLSPDLVVGGYLFITTEGNYTAHFDDLYYTAFQRVKAQGVCLGLEDFQSTIDPNWPAFGEMKRTLQEWKNLRLRGLGSYDNVEQM